MELACWLLFFGYCHIEVVKSLVEMMHLVIKQSSEEVKTRLLLFLAATINGDVQKLPGLIHLLKLCLIVDIVIIH